jgi:hypothetical protein
MSVNYKVEFVVHLSAYAHEEFYAVLKAFAVGATETDYLTFRLDYNRTTARALDEAVARIMRSAKSGFSLKLAVGDNYAAYYSARHINGLVSEWAYSDRVKSEIRECLDFARAELGRQLAEIQVQLMDIDDKLVVQGMKTFTTKEVLKLRNQEEGGKRNR